MSKMLTRVRVSRILIAGEVLWDSTDESRGWPSVAVEVFDQKTGNTVVVRGEGSIKARWTGFDGNGNMYGSGFVLLSRSEEKDHDLLVERLKRDIREGTPQVVSFMVAIELPGKTKGFLVEQGWTPKQKGLFDAD